MRAILRTFAFLLFAALSTSSVHAEALFVPIVAERTAPIQPVVPPSPNIGPTQPPVVQPRPSPLLPFRVTTSRVDVRIEENVATTTLEQSFRNESGRDLEVRVMIPLPAGAAINNSSLSMNDEMIEGKLYTAQEAQSIYQGIVQQRRDPALLRFASDNLYEARIFPVPPNQERRLRFSYTQMLPSSGGMYDYRHILSGSQMYQNGVEKFSFNCTIKSKNTIGPVYSPTHQLAIYRPDANTATITLNSNNLSSDRDLRLYYAPSQGEFAMRMLTYRPSSNEDGYFMLIGRADDQLNAAKIMPKEIVFVLDTSGSMQGEKIVQAKNALKFCVQSLSERDRFNVISFASEVQGLSTKMLDATKENIAKAVAAIESLETTGGTNIDGALTAALGSDFSTDAAKTRMVVFMTDGLPSVGITDPSQILQNVKNANARRVRVFNFGVGHDVNTHMLDKLALEYDGVSAYVAPKEDIEVKVGDFFNKIRHPVMSDITFDFGASSSTNSVYPKRIPALYRGGEVIVMGRYKGTGPGEVAIDGNVGGETKRIVSNVTWTDRDLQNSYLPRVWAMRKIGHLIEEVRLNGQNPELIKEITELAQRHGIVTPYTSQLVLEPGMQNGGGVARPRTRNRAGEADVDGFVTEALPRFRAATAADALKLDEQARGRTLDLAKEVADRANKSVSGEAATGLATFEKALKEESKSSAPNAPAPALAGGAGGRGFATAEREERRKAGAAFSYGVTTKKDAAELGEMMQRAQSEMIKEIGSRTFYNRGGIWVDSTAKYDAKPVTVKMFSPEYFELMKKDSTLGSVFALGGKLLVVVGDTLYEIAE